MDGPKTSMELFMRLRRSYQFEQFLEQLNAAQAAPILEAEREFMRDRYGLRATFETLLSEQSHGYVEQPAGGRIESDAAYA